MKFLKKLIYFVVGLYFPAMGAFAQLVPKRLANTIWVQQGYDRILEINDSTYSYFNINQQDCKPLVQGLFNDRFRLVSFKKDVLVLNPGGIVDYRFTALDALPNFCSTAPKLNRNYISNFKIFWQTFQNNYAFFKERKVDWNSIYFRYLPEVERINSDTAFAALLTEIINTIGDGHIRLNLPDSIRKIGKPKATASFSSKIVRSKKSVLADLTKTYLLHGKSYNGGVLRWGYLKGSNVGYLLITDMDHFANYLPSNQALAGDFSRRYDLISTSKPALIMLKDEVDGADTIMREVMNDFRNADSVIVDLRFNGGGFETVALKLLSFFTSTKRNVISITAKNGLKTTSKQNYFLEPSKVRLTLPVNLLIGPHTASAAEIFALASIPFPNITRIGSKSNGIFSEILWKELPNGWEFGLSNEMYRDAFGRMYEGTGIPVDFEMNYMKDRLEFYQSFYQNEVFLDQALENILKKNAER